MNLRDLGQTRPGGRSARPPGASRSACSGAAAMPRAGRRRARRPCHRSPLQRLIQTQAHLAAADAYRARGRKTRVALAASAATAALAAGAAGAFIAADHASTHPAAPALRPRRRRPRRVRTHWRWRGSVPSSRPATHAAAPPAPPPSPPRSRPRSPGSSRRPSSPTRSGSSGKETESAFASTATKPLAKALAADPPRLPASGKVPKARVLNVVLGTTSKQQITASVSLVRLRAISELRLTLTRTRDEWRVAQVLG